MFFAGSQIGGLFSSVSPDPGTVNDNTVQWGSASGLQTFFLQFPPGRC